MTEDTTLGDVRFAAGQTFDAVCFLLLSGLFGNAGNL